MNFEQTTIFDFIEEKKDDNFIIINDDMNNLLRHIKPNSIDSIITDPPYELNFMNKGWDNAGVSFNKDTWKKCFEVLKPGGYLLAFGGSRTFHRIACAIEDAGFEIRDCIMWLYGSGFPKSMNIGLAIDKKNGVESKVIGTGKSGSSETHTRTMNSETKDGKSVFGGEYQIKEAQNEWNGWGTCLKPAFEPIIVARKPFKGSLVDNVIEYGVGGLNIDECRVGDEERAYKGAGGSEITVAKGAIGSGAGKDLEFTVNGRFPANIILDDTFTEEWSRYFYCAKASKKDRDEGLDEFEEKQVYGDEMKYGYGNNNGDNLGERIANVKIKNTHPTVKPTLLMQYLVRLVTPKGGTILDPFMGSGSTGKAVMYENNEREANYKFVGIELSEEYCNIAKARINFLIKNKK